VALVGADLPFEFIEDVSLRVHGAGKVMAL
jgi:hypothetical protein